MELRIRAIDLQVTPADTSGFLVRVECADAEDVRGQMLRGPDDEADDWPLGKRYTEVCDRLAVVERDLAQRRRDLTEANETLREIRRKIGLPEGTNDGWSTLALVNRRAADYGQDRADLVEARGQLIVDAKTIASKMTDLADAEALLVRITKAENGYQALGVCADAEVFLAARGK